MFILPSLIFQPSHFSPPIHSLSPKQYVTATSLEKSHHKLLKPTSSCSKSTYRRTTTSKSSIPRCHLQDSDVDSAEPSLARCFSDPTTLSSCLKSCSCLRQVKSVHAVSFRVIDCPLPFVGNNLISTYVSFAELVDARKVFDTMPDRNVVTWTAMIHGYMEIGCYSEAIELFEEMSENSVRRNSLTFVSMLKLCGNVLNFELGRQIHACIIKQNCRNMIVDSSIVYFYAKCGDFHGASIIFDEMSLRDVVSWTTMITAYAQNGYGNKAMSMFPQMLNDGFIPNEFTVCSVLKSCGATKALRFGKQLHGAIIKGACREDIYVGSSLVSMYGRCGEILDARTVFNLMPKRNTVTWTSMIAAYAQNGFGEEALYLFKRMKRRRVFANNLTVVSILSACGNLKSLNLGKEVHGQLWKSLSQDNVYVGSTLIWFYCKCGEYSYATRVLESMPIRDVVSWTAIISGNSRLEHGSEALEFLNDMLSEGVDPNPFTYSSALKACAKLEDVRHGKWIHASANKTRSLSNVYVSSALIDMYLKCGCITEASRVFDAMPERNSVSWKTMITGYAKNGRCREALQLMYRMHSEGFYVDDFVLSTVLTSCGDMKWELESSSVAYSHSS